jgi:hypothetical protein
MLGFGMYLNPFQLLYQTTLSWVIYKQCNFVAPDEYGKLKIKTLADVQFGESLFLIDSAFYMFLHGRRDKLAFSVLFYKGTHSIHKGFALLT